MEYAEKLEIAQALRAERRLKHRTLGDEIRARGGSASNDEVRDLYRRAAGRQAGGGGSTAVAVEAEEAPALPNALRECVRRLETGIVAHIATVRAEESARTRGETERLKAEHEERVQAFGGELESLHAELVETAEELSQTQSRLEREREEVATLRSARAEVDHARARETEQHRSTLAELSDRLRHETNARQSAESAVERLHGEVAAIAADRDAARQRVGDIEHRLEEERAARARAEGERDSARQQAEVMRESVVELRARLTATEEVQRSLQRTVERLGRTGRRAKP